MTEAPAEDSFNQLPVEEGPLFVAPEEFLEDPELEPNLSIGLFGNFVSTCWSDRRLPRQASDVVGLDMGLISERSRILLIKP